MLKNLNHIDVKEMGRKPFPYFRNNTGRQFSTIPRRRENAEQCECSVYPAPTLDMTENYFHQ